jgi:hypothetical protein
MDPFHVIQWLVLWGVITRKNDVRSNTHAFLSVMYSVFWFYFREHRKPHGEAIERISREITVGYMIADLYKITHWSLAIHHVTAIYSALFIFGIPSYYGMFSKLMVVELSTPFVNMWLQDRQDYNSWMRMIIAFFIFRMCYVPWYITQMQQVCSNENYYNNCHTDILLLGGFYTMNSWWFYKMLKNRPIRIQ